MIEKLKRIHYMFYASLVFMGFPFISILLGEVPYWHFFLALLFIASYLGILITENKKLIWIYWLYLLAYVAGNTLFINANYFWFYFFISNLLVYHFEIRNFRSPYLWTVFLRMMEELKADHAKQNAQINLLLAENERHRIGRDLHDSLGHTFAMLSVKADLVDQFLALGQVEKAQEQVQEIQAISQESMHQVREIVENLKQRTLARELETVKQMLEVAQVKVEIQNNLDTASISPVLESALAMVSLELATNMIKHAKATQALLTYRSTETGVEMVAEDNGIGFDKVSDKDLHSIRERIALLGGELDISHQYKPTRIEIRIPYQERK